MLQKKNIYSDLRGINYSIDTKEEVKQVFVSKSKKNVSPETKNIVLIDEGIVSKN